MSRSLGTLKYLEEPPFPAVVFLRAFLDLRPYPHSHMYISNPLPSINPSGFLSFS